MGNTYNNVPMTKAEQERVAKGDAALTGPRFIILSFVVLGLAFALLWAAAEGVGPFPDANEMRWGHETHITQSGCSARPWD